MTMVLLPHQTVHSSGSGPAVPLPPVIGPVLQIKLGITHVVEQESLDVSVWGSADGNTWGQQPLAHFPLKFYRGLSVVLIDLRRHPQVSYLQVRWTPTRWGRGSLTPEFTFGVLAEELQPVYQTGDVSGAEAVVNIDHGDIAGAAVEHPKQSR